jgi:hypothetical protein
VLAPSKKELQCLHGRKEKLRTKQSPGQRRLDGEDLGQHPSRGTVIERKGWARSGQLMIRSGGQKGESKRGFRGEGRVGTVQREGSRMEMDGTCDGV